jgi:hypothetical protein
LSDDSVEFPLNQFRRHVTDHLRCQGLSGP